MRKKELENFLGTFVHVSVAHLFIEDRTFVHSGQVIEVDTKFLTLKLNNKKGIVKIKNEDILSILV